MVHALKEAWRVLRKKGILVDLRPRHTNQVIETITDEQAQIITCYDDVHRVQNDVAADQAIVVAVESHLFQLEQSATFGYVKEYDTGTELMNYFLTRNPPDHHPAKIVEKIYQADKEAHTTLRLTNKMQLNCYRKIDH